MTRALASVCALVILAQPAAAVDERIATRIPARKVTVRVKAGDTLSQIADAHNVPGGFERLHFVNRHRISSADLIEPGTVLRLPVRAGRVIEYAPRREPEVSRSWDRSSSSAVSPSASSSASSQPSYSTAGSHNWDQVAQCESGGDWGANTGNGYYGGLQHSLSTWRAYGGTGYPHEHSREAQIAVAERVLAGQGAWAWPHCGAYL